MFPIWEKYTSLLTPTSISLYCNKFTTILWLNGLLAILPLCSIFCVFFFSFNVYAAVFAIIRNGMTSNRWEAHCYPGHVNSKPSVTVFDRALLASLIFSDIHLTCFYFTVKY